MGTPEGDDGKQGIENLFEEIMTENFSNLVKDKRHTSPGNADSPKQHRPKEAQPRHIIIKMAKLKDNERTFKATREKQLPTREVSQDSSDFSTETFQARRDWHELFKVMKSKVQQPRQLYPARLSFKIE